MTLQLLFTRYQGVDQSVILRRVLIPDNVLRRAVAVAGLQEPRLR